MMHCGSIVGDGRNPSPLFLCYRRAGVRKLLPCGERRATDEHGAISSALFDCDAQTDLSAGTLSNGINQDRIKKHREEDTHELEKIRKARRVLL